MTSVSLTRTVLALGLALAGLRPAYAAGRRVECTQQTEGSQVVARVATAAKGHQLEITNLRDLTTGGGLQTAVLSRRGQSVLRIETTLAADAVVSTRAQFGVGFKGIQQLELLPEGDGFRVVADGRRSLPFVAGADPKSVAFEDGQPPPQLRRRKALARALKKLERQLERQPCFAGPTPLVAFEAESDLECIGCQVACGLAYQTCNFAAAAAGAACFFICTPAAMSACYSALKVCLYTEPGCYKLGNTCCPAGCVKDEKTTCCDRGNVCYDVPALGGGTFTACCADGGVCGSYCLAPGERCVNAEHSWWCAADKQGELCDDPTLPKDRLADVRQATCCAEGERCARRSLQPVPEDWPYDNASYTNLCCPGGGTECGLACCPAGTTCCRLGSNVAGDEPLCCPAGQVCDDGDACCPESQLCGGRCCAGPCVNGSCCAPGQGVPCGGQCCFGAFQSCCNNQCCAGMCCNNQCCAGFCVGGVCCPSGTSEVCGPGTPSESCCPKNYDCLNNTCIPCACPADQDCCGDLCCPVGQICCDPGGGTVGSLPRGCYTSQTCFPVN